MQGSSTRLAFAIWIGRMEKPESGIGAGNGTGTGTGT